VAEPPPSTRPEETPHVAPTLVRVVLRPVVLAFRRVRRALGGRRSGSRALLVEGTHRRAAPAWRVLVVAVVCLAVWALLYAPDLRRAAEASPIGTRRMLALALLRPLAAVSEFLQLDHVQNAVERAAGRDPSEASVTIEPVPEAPPEDRPPKRVTEATLEEPLPEATQDDLMRLAVVGDSFATGIGAAMSRAMNPRTVNVQARGVISTGLTRPDYFNWQRAYEEVERRFRPDLTVVMLGGNDSQSLVQPGVKPIPLSERDRWERIYLERIGRFLDAGTEEGGRIVWVGLPPFRDEIRSRQVQRLNSLYARETSRHAGVLYFDAFELFADSSGGYKAFRTDDRGRQQLVRAPDGEHFTTQGYDLLAGEILDSVQERWGLQGNVRR